MTLAPPIVCLITRARGQRGSPERAALIRRLSAAAAAGASMIQIRERHLGDRQSVEFAAEVIGAVASTGCQVVINDRLDIALAANAAGVHLKSDGPTAADVTRVARQPLVIGRSIHSLEEARAAERDGGYDYFFFGTVFPSMSKPDHHPIAGIDGLRRVCSGISIHVIAIGGLTPARAAEVARAGAAGIAAISFFAEARDPAAAVSAFRASLTGPQGRV